MKGPLLLEAGFFCGNAKHDAVAFISENVLSRSGGLARRWAKAVCCFVAGDETEDQVGNKDGYEKQDEIVADILGCVAEMKLVV